MLRPCNNFSADDTSQAGEKQQIDRGRHGAPIRAEIKHCQSAGDPDATSKASSGLPVTGRRPVQFGTAVSRKPAMMAGT